MTRRLGTTVLMSLGHHRRVVLAVTCGALFGNAVYDYGRIYLWPYVVVAYIVMAVYRYGLNSCGLCKALLSVVW